MHPNYQILFYREALDLQDLAQGALHTPENPKETDLGSALLALQSLHQPGAFRLQDPFDVYLILASLNLCNRYIKTSSRNSSLSYGNFKPLTNDLANSLRQHPIEGVNVKGDFDQGNRVFYFSIYGLQFSFHGVAGDAAFDWAQSHRNLPGFDGVRKQPIAVSVFARAQKLYLTSGVHGKLNHFI